MSGAKQGRENISWRKPPLLWWKTLGVVICNHEPIPQSKIETLDLRTSELFPAVTQLLSGTPLTKQDVEKACLQQGREYSLNRFLGRIDSARRWDEKLDYEAVETVYLEITHHSLPSKPIKLTNGKYSNIQMEIALKEAENRCVYCHRPFEPGGAQPVADHYISQKRGGPTEQWNCVAACVSCNLSKGDMLPHDYMRILLYRDSFGRTLKHEAA
jgi:5-methylcytosine-specific restriction endonuclease McrA